MNSKLAKPLKQTTNFDLFSLKKDLKVSVTVDH